MSLTHLGRNRAIRSDVKPRRQVRLPVETGTSAITILIVGTVVVFAIAGGMVAFVEASPVLGGLTFVLWVAALWLTALGFLTFAFQRRAADVLIDEDGIHVDGGPHHGFHWDRETILLEGTRVEQVEGRAKFFLDLGTDIRITLAESTKPEDIASMNALAATLHAWVQGASPQTPPPQSPQAALLVCAHCGAAIAPTDQPASACGHCGHHTPMPDEIVEKVRAARMLPADRARSENLVRTLLRQPGAHSVNLLLTLLGFVLFAVLPFTLATFGVWLFVVAALASLALVFFVRLVVSNRRALRLMELNFRGRAPSREGAPWSCRRCGAPLPSPADDDTVARCMYCGADNLLGVDLRSEATATSQQALHLTDAIRHRRRELATNLGILVVAVALGVGGSQFAYGKHVEVQIAEEESRRIFPTEPPAPHIKRSSPSPTPSATGFERVTKEGDVETRVSSTPDGRYLFFLRKAAGSDPTTPVVRDLTSGQERVIDGLDFTPRMGQPILTDPVLGPNARSLYFVRRDTQGIRLLRYELDGNSLGAESTVHSGSTSERPSRPLPWPDGKTILFSLGPGMAWTMVRKSLTDDGQASLGEGTPYAVKADGSGLLMGREERGVGIETRLVLMEGPKLEKSSVLTSEGWRVSGGALSPDGKRAVFVAKETHSAATKPEVLGNVFGVRVDAGTPVALVGGYAAQDAVAWGIDGRIYFVSDEGGALGIYGVSWSE
jgi:DNA-directed RNA polymerase subunit RPC12/RpoP